MDIGQQLGSFRIARKLGQGGMGEVWQATDARLGRDVALKLLPDDFAAEGECHARFEREAKLLSSLNHPNIATLHGLEHLDGRELYYVTEDGEHMAAAVDGAGGTFAVGQVAKLFDGPYAPGPYRYDATADGKRFLVVAGRPLKALPPMNLVLNWPSGIERR